MVLAPPGDWSRQKAQEGTEAAVEVSEGRHGGKQGGREEPSVGTVAEASMKLRREVILVECQGNGIPSLRGNPAGDDCAKVCSRWRTSNCQLPRSWEFFTFLFSHLDFLVASGSLGYEISYAKCFLF